MTHLYRIELTHGVVLIRAYRSLAQALRKARETWGDNLRAVEPVRTLALVA